MSAVLVPPQDDEVLRALLRRLHTGGRSDGHRIALVIAGGGMRGAYAGGMAHAISDAGLAGEFDVVYGSSAGAYIGAALLAGHGEGAARIFFEDMASPAFIDLRRLRRRRHVVSLDHLIDQILVEQKPLPWGLLSDLPVPLQVVATAVDDLSGHVLQPRTASEWRLAMRATSSIPLLAGQPVALHGRRWIDGSVSEPVPLLRALEDGSTHVLVLMNRDVRQVRRIDTSRRPALWTRGLDQLMPGLGAMAQGGRRLEPILQVLGDPRHPSRAQRHLWVAAPDRDAGVRGLTTDPEKVELATRIGYATLTAALRRAAQATEF